MQGRRRNEREFETATAAAATALSVVERRDRIALADDPADLDPAIESGAVEQRGIDRPRQQLLEILTGEVQPSTAQHRFADLEALADEVIERHAERRQIAAMFSARDRVEHFHFDERDLARVGFWRVGADAIEIPIAFDPATGDQLGFVELLHRERGSFGDMNMEQAAGPAHRFSPGRSFVGATNIPRPRTTRAYSAACRDGGRTLSSPSASVAEMVVRTISRASCAGHGRPRCMVARLSHMTTSPLRQLCT